MAVAGELNYIPKASSTPQKANAAMHAIAMMISSISCFMMLTLNVKGFGFEANRHVSKLTSVKL